MSAWREVGDAVIDALVQDIYAQRERDLGCDVNLEV